MPTNIYWIHSFDNNARIGIMPRPRGGDWLEDEITFLRRQKVDLLISLLETEEITELGLKNEAAYCLKNDLTFLHFPIRDRSIPTKANVFIQTILQHISEGQNVAIHCRMGIGRSSIIAGAVLLSAGYKADEIFSLISKVRGLKVPDTEEQINWLRRYSSDFS